MNSNSKTNRRNINKNNINHIRNITKIYSETYHAIFNTIKTTGNINIENFSLETLESISPERLISNQLISKIKTKFNIKNVYLSNKTRILTNIINTKYPLFKDLTVKQFITVLSSYYTRTYETKETREMFYLNIAGLILFNKNRINQYKRYFDENLNKNTNEYKNQIVILNIYEAFLDYINEFITQLKDENEAPSGCGPGGCTIAGGSKGKSKKTL